MPRSDGFLDLAGCEALLDRVNQLSLRAHIFGHIHEAYGKSRADLKGPISINASICNGAYEPANSPIVFDFDPPAFKGQVLTHRSRR